MVAILVGVIDILSFSWAVSKCPQARKNLKKVLDNDLILMYQFICFFDFVGSRREKLLKPARMKMTGNNSDGFGQGAH